MPNLLNVSEAASLGLHAMAYMVGRDSKPVTTHDIADDLQVSEAHLAKVLQRLHRAGLVDSTRGPKGGFVLARPAGRTTLLQIYEAIEGSLTTTHCLFGRPVCDGKACILGNILGGMNEQVRQHLAQTRLSDLDQTYGEHHG